MKRTLVSLFCLFLLWSTTWPLTALENPPFLGSPLATVLKTDLFQFFHLQAVDAAEEGWQAYRPQASTFRMLACVRLKGDNRVEACELQISRAFIDDKKNSPFANDLAKSFLLEALGPDDEKALAPLINQIWQPAAGAAVPGYDVYRGGAAEWKYSGTSQVLLRNQGVLFIIRVE